MMFYCSEHITTAYIVFINEMDPNFITNFIRFLGGEPFTDATTLTL